MYTVLLIIFILIGKNNSGKEITELHESIITRVGVKIQVTYISIKKIL